MQVLIDINDEDYNDITLAGENTINLGVLLQLREAVRNGIPLYGRLIDADKLAKEIKGYIGDTSNLHYDDLKEAEACNSAYYNCLDEIEAAQTIIEAGRSVEE